MNLPSFRNDEADFAREVASWRLAGLLFECPRPGWQAEVDGLALEASDAELSAAASAAREEASEGLFHTTFGPGGPAAPREVSYRGSVLPGQVIGRLCALYEAFAYQPTSAEPPDHVAIETGFLGYLKLKAAYAHFRGDAEQASIAHAAAERVAAEHLAIFSHPLADALAASGVRYLALAARWLASRTGPPPPSLPLINPEGDDLVCAP